MRLRPRARTLTILVTMVVVLVVSADAAYLSASRQPPVYGVEAEVLYRTDASSSGAMAQRTIATQDELLGSAALLGPVARKAGLAPETLKGLVSVDSSPDSDILTLQVRSEDPAQALAIARDILDRYLETVTDRYAAADARAADLLRTQIDGLNDRLIEVQLGIQDFQRSRAEQGGGIPVGTDERRLEAEVISLPQRIGAVEDRLVGLEVDRLRDTDVSVLTLPFLLPEPVAPRPLRAAVAGAMVGLVIAGGLLLVLLRPRILP